MTDLISVTVNAGKYTIQQTEPGKWEALRYGEEWPAFRDSGPDNLHVALAYEIAGLREQIAYWRRGTDRINDCLKKAVKADPLDAPTPLVGTEAKQWHSFQAEAYRHALEMMGVPECFGPVKKEVSA
ncbi:hypothetical protein HFN71_28565 [Rhizobium laguerreae]|uniref:hypothetical protein n=1 Tax=Rhizobium laguerreae TaxID=1076926 RepID=UPI001C921FDC|nr:hypothetical protein [Rhizobium laguerreae]MBY3543640.1 hypothetical protein [Rhizobium laguerreae]